MRSSELLLRRTCTFTSHPTLLRQQPGLPAPWKLTSNFPRYRQNFSIFHEPRKIVQNLPPTPFRSSLTPVFTRPFSASSVQRQEAQAPAPANRTAKEEKAIPQDSEEELDLEPDDQGFARSEKANQATQVNLSARLAKDGKSQPQWGALGKFGDWLRLRDQKLRCLGSLSSSYSSHRPFLCPYHSR